jgi:hypothetical protein
VVISNVLFSGFGFGLFCFGLNKFFMVLCSILLTRAETS